MSQHNEGQLLQRLWELLDSKLDIIKAPVEFPTGSWEQRAAQEIVDKCKQQARGIAETLAILMDPFITDPDEVARHAGKRWKARQTGERYEVPGLADAIWDPTKNWDGTDRVLPSIGKRKPAPAPRVVKALTDSETAAIKQALATGMFTSEQLAGVYKVSVEQIEAMK